MRLKILLLAPAEQYVYRIWIANRLHSSGVLCQLDLMIDISPSRDGITTNRPTRH